MGLIRKLLASWRTPNRGRYEGGGAPMTGLDDDMKYQVVLGDTHPFLGVPWTSLDDEVTATASAICELMEKNLSEHTRRVAAGCPAARPHLRELRRLFEEHAPEIVAKATDCIILHQYHQLEFFSKSEPIALVVSLIRGDIEGAKDLLIRDSREDGFGYVDLMARITDQLPPTIAGMYHVILAMSLDRDHFSVNMCIANLANRTCAPIDCPAVMPTSLLTSHEKSMMGL